MKTRGSIARVLTLAAIASVLIALTVRLFFFVNRNAVNMMFWDQWDYLGPLFDKRGLWAQFHFQHGPHRQGLGALLIALVYHLSAWDGRAEAFAAAGMMVGTTLLFLATARLAFGRWSLLDASIPLLTLTLTDFELFSGTTNLAHGPVPVFLVASFGLCMFIARHWLRTVVLVVINFFTVFTGFGLLFGLVTPCIFVVLLREREQRRAATVGLLASIVTLAAFGRGYTFQPAVFCFVFPDPHPLGYLTFVAGIVGRPLSMFNGDGSSWKLAIHITAVLLLTIAMLSLVRFFRAPKDARARTIFAYASYAVLFAAFTAVGRLCLGVETSTSSRYVPYMLFGWMAIYFWFRDLADSRPALRVLPIAFLALCIAKNFFRDEPMTSQLAWYTQGKSKWSACYRAKHDIATCDRESGFPVYPDPKPPTFRQRLDYLEQHRLNLFN